METASCVGLRRGCDNIAGVELAQYSLVLIEAGGEEQLARKELERVLSSASFVRSDRVSRLLRFLVERQTEHRDDELKESVIGVEVFGKRPDFDPKLDTTVRSEAVRLRPA